MQENVELKDKETRANQSKDKISESLIIKSLRHSIKAPYAFWKYFAFAALFLMLGFLNEFNWVFLAPLLMVALSWFFVDKIKVKRGRYKLEFDDTHLRIFSFRNKLWQVKFQDITDAEVDRNDERLYSDMPGPHLIINTAKDTFALPFADDVWGSETKKQILDKIRPV